MSCRRKQRAQAQELIVDYYSAHDMVWEGARTLAVDCKTIEGTTIENTQRTTPKSYGFRLDMRACDSGLTGQDGLALDNTNEANHPKMARQRCDQQGAWLSRKCTKYRRCTYGHNVFPCGYCAAHLFVSRLIASTWEGFSQSREPVILYWLPECTLRISFFHEVGNNVWDLHRGLEISSRFSSIVSMYDIDRFTGFGRVRLSSGRVGTSPKSQFPSVR